MTLLTNRTVLVTGANRGIGRAIIDALSETAVARIYATARNPESIVGIDDPRVVRMVLDVTDPDACDRAARTASDVDVLINNAGTLRGFDLLGEDVEGARSDMETNYFGVLNMARAFTPVLERNRPALMVNVLTLLSVASMPAMGGYSASKAAAWSLTMAMRAALRDRGVRVSGVYPGAVDTDMLAGVEMPKTAPKDVARAIVRGIVDGEEDIAPDPMSQTIWPTFLTDPKAVERQFGGM